MTIMMIAPAMMICMPAIYFAQCLTYSILVNTTATLYKDGNSYTTYAMN